MKGLFALREEMGISRKDFAEKVGVEISTVTRWENGEMFPSEVNIRKIKNLLGCSYDALLDGNPINPAQEATDC